MRRADRLFQIVQLLRRDRITTAQRLARELSVSERTIYRDMDDLSASGVPIESEAGVGYRLPKSFDLPPLMFSVDEIEALVLGLRIAESWSAEGLSAAARSALRKIEAVLPASLRERVDPNLYAPSFHIPKRAAAHLDTLRRAIRERRKVRVDYTKPDGAPSQRVLRPLGLFFWGNTWSLAAWCELRVGFRSFRLDRIDALVLLEEGFPVEPGQTLADYEKLMDDDTADSTVSGGSA